MTNKYSVGDKVVVYEEDDTAHERPLSPFIVIRIAGSLVSVLEDTNDNEREDWPMRFMINSFFYPDRIEPASKVKREKTMSVEVDDLPYENEQAVKKEYAPSAYTVDQPPNVLAFFNDGSVQCGVEICQWVSSMGGSASLLFEKGETLVRVHTLSRGYITVGAYLVYDPIKEGWTSQHPESFNEKYRKVI